MARIRRLSIFMPRPSRFYEALLGQMRRGFAACDVETSGTTTLLDADAMRNWLEVHRPDAILEMNRPRCDLPWLPKDVRHIAWIVDWNGRLKEEFCGSDMTYLFCPSWDHEFPHSSFHRWWGPGACPVDYPATEHICETDMAFVGHVPPPWSNAELARLVARDNDHYTFADLLPNLSRDIRAGRGRINSPGDALRIARRICTAAVGSELRDDPVLIYDITTRVNRMLTRRALIDAALTCDKRLELYGPANWQQWPTYAPSYRGELKTPSELHALYTKAAVSLHEGVGLHFRSLDVMASGGLLFYRESAYDHVKPGGIAEVFEPGVHYVPFTLGNLRDQVNRYLADSRAAMTIRKNAAAAVANAHTWRHRARQVLTDYARM